MSPLLPKLTNASADAATSTADTSRRITLLTVRVFPGCNRWHTKSQAGIMVLTERKRERERQRERERERERESFIRNNLHNGVVSGAARGQALLGNETGGGWLDS